jgi:serine/threonine-protein kinase
LAGKYRIERQLGAGGMGMVFEATHLMLSERVAIKVLLPQDGEGREARLRFFREARAAARINSIHVSKVRDIGELESSEPFIVMDYLDGFNLDAWLKEHGALGIEQTARWMLEACQGLAAAHAAGVIHRDIKAANLFIAKTSDGGSVLKILDFGISKLTESQGMAGANLTGTQASMGSPLTMSPEQMLSPRDVDPRTDIWSLGTVLYRCLSGAQPFEAESLPQLCVQIMDGQVIPLQTRRPELPAGMLGIVSRCLRKLPEERFADVAELALALAPFAGEGGGAAAEQCRRVLKQRSAEASGDLRDPVAVPQVAVQAGDSHRQRAGAPAVRGRSLWLALAVVVGLGITVLALRGGGRNREPEREGASGGQKSVVHRSQTTPPPTTPLAVAVLASPDAGPSPQVAPAPNPAAQPSARAPGGKRVARQPARTAPSRPALDPFGQRK